MQITPNEVDRIEEAGTLHDKPVKLVRTKGGFWVAVGRKRRNGAEEALAAGSHPAIVKFNMEKEFPDYQPIMRKSEGFAEPVVQKHSHFLSEDLRKSGHDIFSIQNGNEVEFQVTRHNAQIASTTGFVDSEHLTIETLNIPKNLSKAVAGATVEKSLSLKVGLKTRL